MSRNTFWRGVLELLLMDRMNKYLEGGGWKLRELKWNSNLQSHCCSLDPSTGLYLISYLFCAMQMCTTSHLI